MADEPIVYQVRAGYASEDGTVVRGEPTTIKSNLRPLVRRLKLSGFSVYIAQLDLCGCSTGMSTAADDFDWSEPNV